MMKCPPNNRVMSLEGPRSQIDLKNMLITPLYMLNSLLKWVHELDSVTAFQINWRSWGYWRHGLHPNRLYSHFMFGFFFFSFFKTSPHPLQSASMLFCCGV